MQKSLLILPITLTFLTLSPVARSEANKLEDLRTAMSAFVGQLNASVATNPGFSAEVKEFRTEPTGADLRPFCFEMNCSLPLPDGSGSIQVPSLKIRELIFPADGEEIADHVDVNTLEFSATVAIPRSASLPKATARQGQGCSSQGDSDDSRPAEGAVESAIEGFARSILLV
jgi:hypothetical protein